MKILVIGGCGFIGSHIVDSLVAQGHAVRVFDRQAERFREPLKGVDYRLGSFVDRMAVIEAMSGVDAVMHLASTTFPTTADLDPKIDVQDNLVGTLAILDSMISLRIPRLLFLSSGGTVYGPPETVPIPETHPLRPINSYGIVKVAIESYLDMYARTRGILPIVIRASNPYGPRQAHTGVQGVISTFLRRALLREPIEIWGDGSVERDYVHVADIADLCARAIATDRVGVYNAGSGSGTPLLEIVRVIEAVTGRPLDPVFKPARKMDVQRSVLDVSRAAADFGWAGGIGLRDGIAETWGWLKTTEA